MQTKKMALIDIDDTLFDGEKRWAKGFKAAGLVLPDDRAEWGAAVAQMSSHQKDLYWQTIFHEDVIVEDPMIPCANKAVQALHGDNYQIVYLTARIERLRRVTERQLIEHRFPSGFLFMHPDEDRNPGHLIKRGVINLIAAYGYNPTIAIDDDWNETMAETYRDYRIYHYKSVSSYLEREI